MMSATILEEGLRVFTANHVQAVLLDLNLADSSGLDTSARTLIQVGKVPIVVLTGTNDMSIGARLQYFSASRIEQTSLLLAKMA